MPEIPESLVVRTLANGATAQLRSVIDFANREEARRIHAELLRLAHQLAQKHEFGVKKAKEIVNANQL
jgi:hypothetical protein